MKFNNRNVRQMYPQELLELPLDRLPPEFHFMGCRVEIHTDRVLQRTYIRMYGSYGKVLQEQCDSGIARGVPTLDILKQLYGRLKTEAKNESYARFDEHNASAASINMHQVRHDMYGGARYDDKIDAASYAMKIKNDMQSRIKKVVEAPMSLLEGLQSGVKEAYKEQFKMFEQIRSVTA